MPIPDKALTIGIGTLLEAKKIVLLVTGEAKAEVLRRTLKADERRCPRRRGYGWPAHGSKSSRTKTPLAAWHVRGN